MSLLFFPSHFDGEEVRGVEGQEVTVTPGMFLAPLLWFLDGFLAVYNFEIIFLYHINGLALDNELRGSERFTILTVQESLCSIQENLLTCLQPGVLQDQLAGLHSALLRDLPLVPRLVREIVGED